MEINPDIKAFVGADPDSICRYCGGSHTRDEHNEFKYKQDVEIKGTVDPVTMARELRRAKALKGGA